jgi:hypothetical protein
MYAYTELWAERMKPKSPSSSCIQADGHSAKFPSSPLQFSVMRADVKNPSSMFLFTSLQQGMRHPAPFRSTRILKYINNSKHSVLL